MFCNKCGGELPADKVLCPHCGGQIPPSAIRFSAIAAAAPAPMPLAPAFVLEDKHAQLRREHPELQGVGGWLAIYAWLHLTLIPVLYVSRVVKLGDTWKQSWSNPTVPLVLAFHVYGVIVAVLILNESRVALINARARLVFQVLLGILFLALEARTTFRGQGMSMLVNSAVWLPYFFVSRRVKLTLDLPLPKPQK